MQSAVLAEMRLLASADLDSNILLTVVLAGDGRLAERRSSRSPAASGCTYQSRHGTLSLLAGIDLLAGARACLCAGSSPLDRVHRLLAAT
jgi:hypothetical protein